MLVRLKSSIAWKGQDFDGKEIEVQPGGEVEMSEERANMLLRDYPGRFVLAGREKPAAPAPEVPRGTKPPKRSRRPLK